MSLTTLVLLLTGGLLAVDSDLIITTSRDGKQVDVNCSVQTLQDTGLAHVATLVLTREQNLVETEVASLVYTGGTTTGSDDLYEAVVTSAIGQNGSTESYLNVHWAELSSDLEGNYSCTLHGMDKDYSSMQISRSIELSFADLWPMFQATPQVIQVGLTPVLDLNCAFSDLPSYNVSEIETIDIFHVHDGLYQLIASVTNLSEAQSKPPGAEGVSVSGSVDTQKSESFLEISLEYPDEKLTGAYICNLLGLDYTGNPVQFSRTVQVSAINPAEASLLSRIRELLASRREKEVIFQAALEERNLLNESIQAAHQEHSQLNATYHKLIHKYNQLNFSCSEDISFTSCEDLNLPPGQHIVRLAPFPGQLNYVRVLCHVISPGDVWTVFQKRYDASVDFYRNFTEYEEGFGSLEGEFWLGLKLVTRLMGEVNNQLRVDMTDVKGVHHTRIYPTFQLDPDNDYLLTLEGLDDKGQGMSFNNGSQFVTYDHNDANSCAVNYISGWWFGYCTRANLNGRLLYPGYTGVWWYELSYSYADNQVIQTEMKFRRN